MIMKLHLKWVFKTRIYRSVTDWLKFKDVEIDAPRGLTDVETAFINDVAIENLNNTRDDRILLQLLDTFKNIVQHEYDRSKTIDTKAQSIFRIIGIVSAAAVFGSGVSGDGGIIMLIIRLIIILMFILTLALCTVTQYGRNHGDYVDKEIFQSVTAITNECGFKKFTEADQYICYLKETIIQTWLVGYNWKNVNEVKYLQLKRSQNYALAALMTLLMYLTFSGIPIWNKPENYQDSKTGANSLKGADRIVSENSYKRSAWVWIDKSDFLFYKTGAQSEHNQSRGGGRTVPKAAQGQARCEACSEKGGGPQGQARCEARCEEGGGPQGQARREARCEENGGPQGQARREAHCEENGGPQGQTRREARCEEDGGPQGQTRREARCEEGGGPQGQTRREARCEEGEVGLTT
ncbi:MAG: hypothetical protein WC326_08245 [Candidatus Delongbacteria bacterium]